MDNDTKEAIINRLYETSSHCMHCGSKDCRHGGNREIDNNLTSEDVLRAINLDEYFFKENESTGTEGE